ncbi:hypothetical protein DOTSEDRAFT_32832 [Dothistroma septosporum NZE10]|uniref:Uncharacterized protein n=1 Tax=Dothistroma septosporum (strain NZE10 / CBS 128990) TaxID=675120 RepID=N1PRT2_DOTSN|nr:hypothetical protein DOTSEDRAFT_32832 [Dothistroma septosporum NZE10]
MEAALALLFPGKFHLEQHVIYLIFEPSHGYLAEIALTRIGQGYIHNAGGYSHYAAGRSNRSAHRPTAEQYRSWRKWAYEHTSMRENHDANLRLLAAQPDNVAPKGEDGLSMLGDDVPPDDINGIDECEPESGYARSEDSALTHEHLLEDVGPSEDNRAYFERALAVMMEFRRERMF